MLEGTEGCDNGNIITVASAGNREVYLRHRIIKPFGGI